MPLCKKFLMPMFVTFYKCLWSLNSKQNKASKFFDILLFLEHFIEMVTIMATICINIGIFLLTYSTLVQIWVLFIQNGLMDVSWKHLNVSFDPCFLDSIRIEATLLYHTFLFHMKIKIKRQRQIELQQKPRNVKK